MVWLVNSGTCVSLLATAWGEGHASLLPCHFVLPAGLWKALPPIQQVPLSSFTAPSFPAHVHPRPAQGWARFKALPPGFYTAAWTTCPGRGEVSSHSSSQPALPAAGELTPCVTRSVTRIYMDLMYRSWWGGCQLWSPEDLEGFLLQTPPGQTFSVGKLIFICPGNLIKQSKRQNRSEREE